jgi:hypothetical protein
MLLGFFNAGLEGLLHPKTPFPSKYPTSARSVKGVAKLIFMARVKSTDLVWLNHQA